MAQFAQYLLLLPIFYLAFILFVVDDFFFYFSKLCHQANLGIILYDSECIVSPPGHGSGVEI